MDAADPPIKTAKGQGEKPMVWWRSVTVKMMAWTLLLLVPTLSFGVWTALSQHHDLEMEQVAGDVEQVASTIIRSFEYASPPNMSVHTRNIDRALGDLELIRNVRLIATDGSIVFSRVPEEEGQLLLPDETEPCAHCHVDGISERNENVVFNAPDGTPVYHQIFSVPNQASCVRCHVEELDELGLLLISFDFSDSQAEIQQFRISSGVTILVSMLVLMGGIAFLFRRLVGRPLREMTRKIQQVERGDFEIGEAPGTSDELGTLHDAFARMASELEAAQAQMQAKVRHGTERVVALTRKLETINVDVARLERLSTLGAVSAKVTHEMRTPLNALSLNLQLLRRLLRQSKSPTPPDVLELTDNAHQEIERISDVLARFMEHARMPRPSFSLEDVGQLIRGVLLLLAADAKQVGVELAFAVLSDVDFVEVPADSIRQILINLVHNAVAASPPGSKVRVEVSRVEASLAEGARPTPERLRFVVIDKGDGIAEANLKRIFEPFYTTREHGTGLGLAVVRQILEQLGGDIQIDSTVGEGTTVSISLPIQSAKKAHE